MGAIYCYTNLINQKKYINQNVDPNQRPNLTCIDYPRNGGVGVLLVRTSKWYPAVPGSAID